MSEAAYDESEYENDAQEEEKVEEAERDELINEFQNWIDNGLSDDDIILKLHTDHELNFPQAVSRLRKLKSEAGLTRGRNNMDEVIAFIKTQHENGEDRDAIVSGLVDNFNYTEKSAASTFSTQASKIGIVVPSARVRVPLKDVVKFLRDNLDLQDEDLVEKMHNEMNYAKSTCKVYVNNIAFAQEWLKQETDEN